MLTIVLLVFISHQSVTVDAIPLPQRMLEEGSYLIIPIGGGQTFYDNDVQDLAVGQDDDKKPLSNVLFRRGCSAGASEEPHHPAVPTLWLPGTSEGSSLHTTGQRSELSGDKLAGKYSTVLH